MIGLSIRKDATYLRPVVKSMIADAIRNACDDHYADLSRYILRGMTVLIKPNWVLHENHLSGCGTDCLITHREVVLAVLDMVKACGPGRIIIGDAPLQGCNLDRILTPDYLEELNGAEVVDFRRTIMAGDSLSSDVVRDRRPLDRYVHFNLGTESMLEPISKPGCFRVTMYNPDELAKTHGPGNHQYLIAKEAIEADVVVNLPKLKTHRKTGITCALKNLVGINGNKDYLPHHRFGGSDIGGDCYEGHEAWKHRVEGFYDDANRHINDRLYEEIMSMARAELSKHEPAQLEGAWQGNDTCWRTCIDLNRCLRYGDVNGDMHEIPQRTVISIVDAITCGHGEGPLTVEPVNLGAIIFGESSVDVDVAGTTLLGFDTRPIRLLDRAGDVLVSTGDKKYHSIDELKELAVKGTRPPVGWPSMVSV